MLEILSEGLGSSLQESAQKKKKVQMIEEKKQQVTKMQTQKRALADSISYVTSDPVLKSVLSHTAETTLKEQVRNEIPTRGSREFSGDSVPSLGSSDGPGLDISSLFNKNWESAAFGKKKSV